jgi:hypothetical protein
VSLRLPDTPVPIVAYPCKQLLGGRFIAGAQSQVRHDIASVEFTTNPRVSSADFLHASERARADVQSDAREARDLLSVIEGVLAPLSLQPSKQR